MSIPLHIIYVNDDEGNPPLNNYRLSEEISKANLVYEGLLNFYVCGYHHINSSNYTAFDFNADRVGLFNYYHVDDAVNVYIVKNIDSGASAIAAFPWLSAPNNFIVLGSLVQTYTLAHELGHYFGLFHTHSILYRGVNLPNCFLQPDSTNLDMVDDTPYDPGPNVVCPNLECPTALTPCTLTCNQSPTVTYTYEGFFTDNVMSYHNCLTQRFTAGQITRMSSYIFFHPDRIFLLSANPSCNNGIAEDGYINKYCQISSPNPDITPIKDLRVKLRNEVTGWEGSVQKTEVNGKYVHFSNDYSNQSYVTINPQISHPFINLILVDPDAVPANYHPENTCNEMDIIRTGKHILHGNVLTPPYSYIAADVNLSGSITTFDVVSMRKVFLGLVPDFPSGTWHYVPEYYFNNANFETAFNAFPFSATYAGLGYPSYLDEVVLDMDDALAADPQTWSFRGIKMGDVNCDMVLDQFSAPGGGLVTSGLIGGTCVQTNDVITIEVKGSVSQALLGYQLGMQYDQTKLHFLGSSAGNLIDYSPEYIAENSGKIRALWNRSDFESEAFTNPKTFFKLHFRALEGFCSLSGIFDINDAVVSNEFYNGNIEPMQGNIAISYQKETPQGNLTTIYPNPATNTATFSFQLNQSNLVEIRLSDYLGGVLNMSQQYNAGSFSYTFPTLSSLGYGPLNYTVKIGSLTYSGILVKSLP